MVGGMNRSRRERGGRVSLLVLACSWNFFSLLAMKVDDLCCAWMYMERGVFMPPFFFFFFLLYVIHHPFPPLQLFPKEGTNERTPFIQPRDEPLVTGKKEKM